MKIAQVVCTYPPYRGGIGQVAYEYVERLRLRGHRVHVFTPRHRLVADDPKYVHRVPSPVHLGNAGFLPSLSWRLKGFDLVHLHYPFFGGAEPVIVRKYLADHQGLIMTYHMDAVAAGVKGALFAAHRRLLFPWIVSRADRILVSTQGYADTSALSKYPELQNKIEIQPFSVDLERFHPGAAENLRVQLGIKVGVPVLLFVGGLDSAHYFKGLPVLLSALSEMAAYPWHLVIVGSGALRATFEAEAAALNLADRIHFVGAVDPENLPEYYRLADMHCFPSINRAEAFGLVALEAAASGLPTIASALPGVSEVVLDGETGLLVPPNDAAALRAALVLLLEQVDLRERLGLSARKRAEASFAWPPLLERLEQTYRAVLAEKN